MCQPGYFFGGTAPAGTGHFTQVVWSESVQLGIGKATGRKNNMNCVYVVGRYKIAGNLMGAYNANVKKGTFDRAVYCQQGGGAGGGMGGRPGGGRPGGGWRPGGRRPGGRRPGGGRPGGGWQLGGGRPGGGRPGGGRPGGGWQQGRK